MMMRMINRRETLVGGAIFGCAVLARAQDQVTGAETAQMPAPSLVVVAEKTSSNLLGPGQPSTAHLRFNIGDGSNILRAKQNAPFAARFLNTTGEDIWVHFFGLRIPSDMASFLLPAQAGEGVDIRFTPPDAGTFWFGPLLNASRHRESGLVGLLIVEEEEIDPAFVDIPLILDDWKLEEGGALEGGFGDLEAAAGEGRLGNWFTVNGVFKPRITLPAGKVARLRLLNVANTRTIHAQFRNMDLLHVALDGQPLKPRALSVEPLELVPGQRADVLVMKLAGEAALAFELFEDTVEAAFFNEGGALAEVPPAYVLPANPVTPVESSAEPRIISIALEGGLKGGLQSARVGDEVLDLRGLLERGIAWAIGGVAGLKGPPLFTLTKGEVVILEFDNRTSFSQPLHLHGHVWRPLEENGQVIEGGTWRDTANIPSKAKARFLMVADNPGAWALQSLIAERSDAGLLAGFTVSDMP